MINHEDNERLNRIKAHAETNDLIEHDDLVWLIDQVEKLNDLIVEMGEYQ